MVCGSSSSIRPARFFQSLGLTPAARTAIRTWPGPACGSGRSAISRTSGPPNRLNRTAFINRSDLCLGYRACALAAPCPPGRAKASVDVELVALGVLHAHRVVIKTLGDQGPGE